MALSAALLLECYNPTYSFNADAGAAFHCFNSDNPPCPSGLVCCVGTMCGDQLASNQEGWCVPPPPVLDMSVTPISYWDFGIKTMYYGGVMMDPMLTGMDPDSMKWRCHRDDTNPNPTDPQVVRALEPNDLPATAISLSNPLATDPPPTQMGSPYEICPDHTAPDIPDVDVFKFKLTSATKVIAEIKYAVMYGDLDVALFLMAKDPDTGADTPQRIMADLSATDNGCIEASNLMPGTYYVVVRGTTTPEKPGIYSMNNYSIRVYTTTMGASCAAKKDGGM
jgi:hypothetical protein